MKGFEMMGVDLPNLKSITCSKGYSFHRPRKVILKGNIVHSSLIIQIFQIFKTLIFLIRFVLSNQNLFRVQRSNAHLQIDVSPLISALIVEEETDSEYISDSSDSPYEEHKK